MATARTPADMLSDVIGKAAGPASMGFFGVAQGEHSPMSKPTKPGTRVDNLMNEAERALRETNYFECELKCLDALTQAQAAHDYERMARVLLPLQEARRQIRLLATDGAKLQILNQAMTETWCPTKGCWLVEPPLVGADARELRERARRAQVPVAVLAREPLTASKKIDSKGQFHAWPVVLIGPVTVRTYVRPPKGEKPTLAWFLEACEMLGDAAIASIDPESDACSRVDDLLNRLMAVPDHEKLHQALEQACREAITEAAQASAKAKPNGAIKSVDPAEADEDEEEDD